MYINNYTIRYIYINIYIIIIERFTYMCELMLYDDIT
jgi:hypothetical protein